MNVGTSDINVYFCTLETDRCLFGFQRVFFLEKRPERIGIDPAI